MLSIIVAKAKNDIIGKDNNLIWHLPDDLKFFKQNTIGKPIVMGLNTLKSLPRKLVNRKYIVLTNQDVKLDSDIKVVKSLELFINK